MRQRLRSRVSYANVASTLALLVALATGGAYAASHLAKNSVGSVQIKRNAVGHSEMKDASVGSPEVINGSLLSEDFAPGQLPTGPISNLTERQSAPVTVSPDASVPASVQCANGEQVVGGGFGRQSGDANDFNVDSSGKLSNGWFVQVTNVDWDGSHTGGVSFVADAECAS